MLFNRIFDPYFSLLAPFSTEYKFLSSLSNNLKMETASLLYNENKNRYQSIKPYDDNRVKLVKLQNKDGSDYINASWIDTYLRKKAFIASQAPLIETTADFWRMIYENKSWVIVMLGQEIENGEVIICAYFMYSRPRLLKPILSVPIVFKKWVHFFRPRFTT